MDTDSSAIGRFIINSRRLALEVAPLQWMEGVKELFGGNVRILLPLTTCMESPRVTVPKDSCKGGA